ncbi:hypothetical protein ACFQJ7_11745 [Halovenus rubra]|uniref:Uncharacterized protein n=2 Tax=Halovenus rubra TaxID=869890 RepID=A0ACC7E3X3_9EURY|nr:hypothetical protein [Halovenus rubra]
MSDEDEKQSNGDKTPFEELNADVGNRDGDPFERLPRKEGDETITEPGGQSQDGAEDTYRRESESEPTPKQEKSNDWVEEFGVEAGTADGPPVGDDSQETESLNDKVTESEEASFGTARDGSSTTEPLGDVSTREGDPFEEGESLFEEQETDGIDPDTVWKELASAESDRETDERYERTFADVSKHSYCEQCEHFSSPPDVACTNEGTDIVEFLDVETVRVVDCPVVKERKELEEE